MGTKAKVSEKEKTSKPNKTVIKTMPVVNLFDSAPSIGASKKKEQETVLVHDLEFSKILEDRAIAFDNIKQTTSVKEKLDERIKAEGMAQFMDVIKSTGVCPKNLVLEARNGMRMTYFSGGSFAKIDSKESADMMTDKYGDDVVESSDSYVINPEMIAKYSHQISKAIAMAADIDEADKGNIIKKVTKYSVTGQFFNILPELLEVYKQEEVWADFKPSMSIKEPVTNKIK